MPKTRAVDGVFGVHPTELGGAISGGLRSGRVDGGCVRPRTAVLGPQRRSSVHARSARDIPHVLHGFDDQGNKPS